MIGPKFGKMCNVLLAALDQEMSPDLASGPYKLRQAVLQQRLKTTCHILLSDDELERMIFQCLICGLLQFPTYRKLSRSQNKSPPTGSFIGL